MAAGLHYVASARTLHRTSRPTTLLFFHMCVAAVTYQRPLFTEPLLNNGCSIIVYFAVVA
jgi:hypothetical protein